MELTSSIFLLKLNIFRRNCYDLNISICTFLDDPICFNDFFSSSLLTGDGTIDLDSSRGGNFIFFFDDIFYNLELLFCIGFRLYGMSMSKVMCLRDKTFLSPFGLIIILLLLFLSLWRESSILMFFYDLIFLRLFILKLDYSSFFEVLLKVTFRSSYLGFGNLTARNLSTLGHLIGSSNFTSPSSALKEERLASIPLKIAVSSNSEADGLISSSTIRHILTKFLNCSE